MFRSPASAFSLLALCVASVAGEAVHASDNWIAQSWLFDWDPPGTQPTVSIPQTAQCETLFIKWTRATGNVPDYVPPFYLRIYTSTFPFPIVVDAGEQLNTSFTVPFAPGTQYQICMVDSQGNSGGCQASYTVYPNPTIATNHTTNQTTLVPATCGNLTYPTQSLNVTGIDNNGPLTQMAWTDQCNDISVTPLNGTPPFVLTVAPTYHPPLNITSDSMKPINWTVTLGWAHQYYLSLVDSQGLSWSIGPLHSGGNGLTDCLVLGGNSLGIRATLESRHNVSPGVAAGASVAALVVGIMIGGLTFWWIAARRRPVPASRIVKRHSSVTSQTSQREHMNQYGITPYPSTPEPSTMSPDPSTSTDVISRAASPPGSPPAQVGRSLSERTAPQVYVVHHDGGRPPISVYHTEGAEVVELPPSYGPGTPVDAPLAQSARAIRRLSQKMRGSSSRTVSNN